MSEAALPENSQRICAKNIFGASAVGYGWYGKILSHDEQAEGSVEVEIDILKPDTVSIKTPRLLIERN